MKGDVFNVGSGIEFSITEAISNFFEAFEIKPQLLFNGINKEGNPLNWKADIKKLTSLGYQNNHNFKNAITLTAKWLKANG